jgi:hypothetical protein
MFQESHQPFMADCAEEVSDVEIQNPVHLLPLNANHQRIQCIMLLWGRKPYEKPRNCGLDRQPEQKIYKVGYLSNNPSEGPYDRVLLDGLRELASKDSRTIRIEARNAAARSEQLPAMARDLVSRGVDVIAAWSPRAVVAAMDATSIVPVVGLSMGTW